MTTNPTFDVDAEPYMSSEVDPIHTVPYQEWNLRRGQAFLQMLAALMTNFKTSRDATVNNDITSRNYGSPGTQLAVMDVKHLAVSDYVRAGLLPLLYHVELGFTLGEGRSHRKVTLDMVQSALGNGGGSINVQILQETAGFSGYMPKIERLSFTLGFKGVPHTDALLESDVDSMFQLITQESVRSNFMNQDPKLFLFVSYAVMRELKEAHLPGPSLNLF